jgi:antitoxin component YwqK of YwqJK toxin-antitoxin module
LFSNGKVKRFVRYKNNIQNGFDVLFSENGDTLRLRHFEYGKIISEGKRTKKLVSIKKK